MMSRIRGRNTRPEVVLRKALHRRGFRFRLNAKKLSGSPDIVLPRWKTVLFVHGCYWHRHPGCRKATTPSSNVEFWAKKFRQNVERDARNIRDLQEAGWRVGVVWVLGDIETCSKRKSAKDAGRTRMEPCKKGLLWTLRANLSEKLLSFSTGQIGGFGAVWARTAMLRVTNRTSGLNAYFKGVLKALPC
jgi:DNA mismatch endonuclease (patch repair protein)